MARKRISGNFFTDAKRFLAWGSKGVGKRMKGKGRGFLHHLWEAMNR